MTDTPTPGNIMGEPLPAGSERQAARADGEEFEASLARLTQAKDEAIAAVKDIVKARPMAAAGIAAGIGLFCGILCRRSH